MLSILKDHSILYVEDDPNIQASIAEYLGNYFNEIHLASNGSEALDSFAKHQPDVLLLDINLPDIDGLSIAQQVRKNNSSSRIIMLTAYTEKEKHNALQSKPKQRQESNSPAEASRRGTAEAQICCCWMTASNKVKVAS